MVSPINTALSGLAAASKRLEVSANNIANAQSTRSKINGVDTDQPYVPQQVQQVSQPNGGVVAKVKDVDPATTPVFDPTNEQADENGTVQYPNTDLATDLINQEIASYDFKANLKTLKVADNLQKYLLDIMT